MNRKKAVWYILGILALLLMLGIVIVRQEGKQPGNGQEPFPNWDPGAWWRYEVTGGKAVAIRDFAYERLIQATAFERTVIDNVTVDDISLLLVADRYLSDESQTTQILFIAPDTLSTYLIEDIIADFQKQELALPLEEGKTWMATTESAAEVVGRETIELSGKSVEAYHIIYSRDGTQRSVWYAPEARVRVQLDVQGTDARWGQLRLVDWGQMAPQEAVDRVYDGLETMSEPAPASTLQALEVLERYGIGLKRNDEILEKMMSRDTSRREQ